MGLESNERLIQPGYPVHIPLDDGSVVLVRYQGLTNDGQAVIHRRMEDSTVEESLFNFAVMKRYSPQSFDELTSTLQEELAEESEDRLLHDPLAAVRYALRCMKDQGIFSEADQALLNRYVDASIAGYSVGEFPEAHNFRTVMELAVTARRAIKIGDPILIPLEGYVVPGRIAAVEEKQVYVKGDHGPLIPMSIEQIPPRRFVDIRSLSPHALNQARYIAKHWIGGRLVGKEHSYSSKKVLDQIEAVRNGESPSSAVVAGYLRSTLEAISIVRPLKDYIDQGLHLIQEGTETENMILLEQAMSHFSNHRKGDEFKIAIAPTDSVQVSQLRSDRDLQDAIVQLMIHSRPGEIAYIQYIVPDATFATKVDLSKYPDLFKMALVIRLLEEEGRIKGEEWIHELQKKNRGPIYLPPRSYDIGDKKDTDEADILAYFLAFGIFPHNHPDLPLFINSYSGRKQLYRDIIAGRVVIRK